MDNENGDPVIWYENTETGEVNRMTVDLAILAPSLMNVGRMARVALCASQLHQAVNGLRGTTSFALGVERDGAQIEYSYLLD